MLLAEVRSERLLGDAAAAGGDTGRAASSLQSEEDELRLTKLGSASAGIGVLSDCSMTEKSACYCGGAVHR